MSVIPSLTLGRAKILWLDHYNLETNWYAFWLPLSFWLGCWLYAKATKKDFGRWAGLHAVHNAGAIIIASISLYFDDDSICNERVGQLWSMAYFTIETTDQLLQGHVLYILHGFIALLLGLANYNIPLLRSLRMNSKASYIELSSLLLPYVKRYRKPWLFFAFAVVYTLCRMIWVPFMIKDLLHHGMELSHPVVIGVSVFYCLNIHWYIKIIKIAFNSSGDNGNRGKTNNKAKKG